MSETTKKLPRDFSNAFTLVELLVVISIIALLLSILMPSLQKARELAKAVVCTSNLHQIALGTQAYLADNGGRFYEYYQDGMAYREFGQGGIPTDENVEPDDPRADSEDWRPLNEYVENYKAWICPSDRGRDSGVFPPIKPSLWSIPEVGTSYMFNVAGIPGKWGPTLRNGNPNINSNSMKIRQPAQFVIFSEYCMYDVMWQPLQDGARWVSGYGTGLKGTANTHDAYGEAPSPVVNFADGHSGRLKEIKGKGGGGHNFGYTLVPSYGTRQDPF